VFRDVFSTGRAADEPAVSECVAVHRFGKFGGDILIGNFGNTGRFAGWISAFGSRGELRDPTGRPIAIDGLWALSFGTFAASDGDTLYFTAGIHDEADGLFGKLTAVAGRDR
jgi:hypothetical protein